MCSEQRFYICKQSKRVNSTMQEVECTTKEEITLFTMHGVNPASVSVRWENKPQKVVLYGEMRFRSVVTWEMGLVFRCLILSCPKWNLKATQRWCQAVFICCGVAGGGQDVAEWSLTWLPGGTVVKNTPSDVGDARDAGSIPGSRRCPEEGNGNPLQYSCLQTPWTEESGRLQSMELLESGTVYELSTHTYNQSEQCLLKKGQWWYLQSTGSVMSDYRGGYSPSQTPEAETLMLMQCRFSYLQLCIKVAHQIFFKVIVMDWCQLMGKRSIMGVL